VTKKDSGSVIPQNDRETACSGDSLFFPSNWASEIPLQRLIVGVDGAPSVVRDPWRKEINGSYS
jgi:hypothetical protein